MILDPKEADSDQTVWRGEPQCAQAAALSSSRSCCPGQPGVCQGAVDQTSGVEQARPETAQGESSLPLGMTASLGLPLALGSLLANFDNEN